MGSSGEIQRLPVGSQVQCLHPLSHLKMTKQGAVEQRWVGQLASFDFELRHKPDQVRQNAPTLAQCPGTSVVAQVQTNKWAKRRGQDPVVAWV